MGQFQPPGFEARSVNTSLGTMAYYTSSPDREMVDVAAPPLVFLHSVGGGSSAYEWSQVYPAFAGRHRVLAPDLVGWGQSAHPVREYQVTDYHQMLGEFLAATAATPAVVVASSLTAGMVIRLAIEQPTWFRGLLLVCPTGFGDFGLDYQRGLAAQLARVPGLDRLLYAVGAANAEAVRNFMAQFLFARRDRISEEMVQAYLASALQPNAEYAALASLRGDLCFDLARYLGQLTVPTAMFWGEEARFTPCETGRRLAALNPEAVRSFEAIAETGVWPHLELPAVMIGLLERSLRQLLADPR